MTRIVSLLLFGLLVFAAAGASAQTRFLTRESPSNEGEVPWLMNLDDAYKEAKRSGKPILLTFRCVP